MDQNTTPAWVLWSIGIGIYLAIVGEVGSYIAEQKGRSVGGGFLFGFFFGPLGLVIEACVPTLGAQGKMRLEDLPVAPPVVTERRTVAPAPPKRGLLEEVQE